MSKIALLELSNLTVPLPGREVEAVWAQEEAPSCRPAGTKRAPSPAPTLAIRLRARLSSLTALEARALFTLVNRPDTGEETLLKCAAGETGVSEALIVKIAKKLGFEGYRGARQSAADPVGASGDVRRLEIARRSRRQSDNGQGGDAQGEGKRRCVGRCRAWSIIDRAITIDPAVMVTTTTAVTSPV